MPLLGVNPSTFGLHTELNTSLALSLTELKGESPEAQPLTELIYVRILQYR